MRRCHFCAARAVYHVKCEDSVVACRRHLARAVDRSLDTDTDLRVLIDYLDAA